MGFQWIFYGHGYGSNIDPEPPFLFFPMGLSGPIKPDFLGILPEI